MHLCKNCYKLFREAFTYVDKNFLAIKDHYHCICAGYESADFYRDRILWCNNCFQNVLFFTQDM